MSTTIYARGSRRRPRGPSSSVARLLPIAALLCALASGCRGDRPAPAQTAESPADADARVYGMACARCHATDGAGDGQLAGRLGTIPPLKSARVAAMSTADLEAVIRSGRGAMPAHEKRLSSDQIRAAAAHVRRLNGLEP